MGLGIARYRSVVREAVVGSLLFHFACIENFECAVDSMYEELAANGEAEKLESLCPYFGILWPGATVLARWLWENGRPLLQGKRVLELGCGLALPSFVANRLGAEVVASDSHPDVPLFLARNLELNPGTSVTFRQLDWEDTVVEREPYDLIFASDVLYEPKQAETLVSFLSRKLTSEGKALLLDPDRSYWPQLVQIAPAVGLRAVVENLSPRSQTDPRCSVLIHLNRS